MIHVRRFLTLAVAGAAVLAALLVQGPTLFGQQQLTRIMGTVTGADGKPVVGADVLFERTDIKATYPTKTKKDGTFDYPTLPKGIYNLTITVNGAKVWDEEDIRTDPTKPKEVTVDLKAAASTPAAAAHNGLPKFIGLPGSKLLPLDTLAAAAPAGTPGEPAPVAIDTGPTPEEIAAQKAEYERQKKEYEEAAAKVNGLKEAFALAEEAAKSGHYDQAIANYLKCTQFDPKVLGVWANLGEVYRRLAEAQEKNPDYKDQRTDAKGNYLKAVDAYQKAVEIKPDATLYVDQSLAYGRAGKMTEALDSFNKGIALDPMLAARGYSNLGFMEYDATNYDKAEGYFRKAVGANPDYAPGHYGLGLSLFVRGTDENGKYKAPAGTAEELQKYIQLAPTTEEAQQAKEMLGALGAAIPNHITQPNNQKSNPKGKGNAK